MSAPIIKKLSALSLVATTAVLSQIAIKNPVEAKVLPKNIETIPNQSLVARVRPEQIIEGALSGAIERYVERKLDSEQVNFNQNWGNQISVRSGAKVIKVKKCKKVFRGKVCYWEPQTRATYKKVNHGLWSKGWVRFEDNLNVNLRNFYFSGNKLRFQAIISGLLRNKTDVRAYNHGVKLGSTRVSGRARIKTTVNIEVSFSRNGRNLSWRTRSTGANIKLQDVYFDRVSRIGGYSAKVIGDATHGAFRYWFTKKYNSVRRDVVQSVVQAAARDQEVKIAYPKLVNSKSITVR
ncbi:hypothetical protein [Mastigocoleus testarum]|uniref:Uncharacterized protein n=1 Tax=Mastigocoleus testarum BC008 TaxID=371196 RepID=A0A0V7ZDU5_9CYAN|nr:hypothetical protein [Mastigocoleus testarum]KST62670.1 hypothetical protein BC008_38225 [Mastigocoleus testarum BC008]